MRDEKGAYLRFLRYIYLQSKSTLNNEQGNAGWGHRHFLEAWPFSLGS